MGRNKGPLLTARSRGLASFRSDRRFVLSNLNDDPQDDPQQEYFADGIVDAINL
jgi:hypothetical protein